MAGGSKSNGTQTTTTSMPGMNGVIGAAQNVFNKGSAWAPDTSSMVTPFSNQTKQALGGMQNTATGAMPAFADNFNRINSTIADGGLNDLQDQQVGRLQGMAGGNGFNATQQQAVDFLNPIAAGKDRQNNPYLEDVINRSAGNIGNAGNLMASQAGRYGSDSHAGILGEKIGDMASGLRYQDYGAQQGRMDNAINQLFGAGTQGAAQKNDAIGSLFNAGTQQRQNVLGGTQQLNDAYTAKLSPFQTLAGVGNRYEDLYSRQLADKSRIFNEKKNAQTAPLDWINGLLHGFQGGQQVTNTSVPNSPLKNALGGGMAGYDMGGGPISAGLGALIGML